MLFRRKTPTYTITVPSDVADVSSIIYLAGQTFGSNTILNTTVHDAYRKNPYCGLIVKDANNNVAGYMDFFLLKPATFDAFLAGTTAEEYLVSADILPYGSAEAHNRIYLGGIAAFAPTRRERGKAVQILLHACARLLQEKYLTTTPHVDAYATGYSAEGVVLLQKLGFQRVNDGTQRADGQPLYHCNITAAWVQKLQRQHAAAARHYHLTLRA